MTKILSTMLVHTRNTFWQCVLPICILLISGCNENQPASPLADTTTTGIRASQIPVLDPDLSFNIQELLLDYIQQIDQDFANLESNVVDFKDNIDKFLSQPDPTTMIAVKSAWLNAHRSYESTALDRYFAGLILPEEQSLALFQLQYRINNWPILPGYIDYVEGYADSGIVNDITVNLTIDSLREQHGAFDVAESTLGFHVIEYLLWGLNSEQDSLRPVSDYAPVTTLSAAQSDSGLLLEQLAPNRRRQLLALTTEALLLDIRSMQALWSEGSAKFRSNLGAADPAALLAHLMDSMADMLTEELLVRSLYPLLNSDFSDSIQSPYSHTTQNAVSAQLSSIEKLIMETVSNRGVTLDSLLNTLSLDFADFFYQNFDTSKECLVLLYSNLKQPDSTTMALQTEYNIVECINLVTNMINHLQQIKLQLI